MVAPLVGPWVAVAEPAYNEMFKNDIKLMTELVKKLPDIERDHDLDLAESVGEVGDPRHIEGASLRAIRVLLEEKDPAKHWGGLKKVLTPASLSFPLGPKMAGVPPEGTSVG